MAALAARRPHRLHVPCDGTAPSIIHALAASGRRRQHHGTPSDAVPRIRFAIVPVPEIPLARTSLRNRSHPFFGHRRRRTQGIPEKQLLAHSECAGHECESRQLRGHRFYLITITELSDHDERKCISGPPGFVLPRFVLFHGEAAGAVSDSCRERFERGQMVKESAWVWVRAPRGPIPKTVQNVLRAKLERRVRRKWNGRCRSVVVRFRGNYAYVDAFPQEDCHMPCTRRSSGSGSPPPPCACAA